MSKIINSSVVSNDGEEEYLPRVGDKIIVVDFEDDDFNAWYDGLDTYILTVSAVDYEGNLLWVSGEEWGGAINIDCIVKYEEEGLLC